MMDKNAFFPVGTRCFPPLLFFERVLDVGSLALFLVRQGFFFCFGSLQVD